MTTRFSIIIPTVNEAARLEAALRAARAAFGPTAEIIVSDGGSTDGTIDCAVAADATVICGPRGRGVQLDAGFRASTGAICIFLHADTLLPVDARSAIERALAPASVAGGAFRLRFTDDERPGALLRAWQKTINVRSRLFRTATGDQAIFARRDVLEAIGGVPHVPLFEDVRLCRKLKRMGTFAVVRDTVSTSTRLWQRVGTLNGIGLHLGLRMLHALGASPFFLSRFYPTAR